MAQIQPVQAATSAKQAGPINGLTNNELNTRMNELIKTDPIDQATPKRDIPFYTSIRNNVMLDKVLANQKTLIQNQNKIMQKLEIGERLDLKV